MTTTTDFSDPTPPSPASMPESLISLKDLIKDYKTMRALDGITLEIMPGITGLLGPNGAGKSTLIKILLGLVKITSGSGTVLGHRLGSEGRAIRNKVGYMPEEDCYVPGMSGVEVVQYAAALSGLPIIEGLRRAHEILDFCGMKQERYRVIDTFSTGMRQKIKFAAAIVHDPELLILDEPTSGLDPEERESLLNRIRILATQAGKSVIISTHILPDVQAICDHALIVANGKVRLNDSLANIIRTVSPSVTIKVRGDSSLMEQRLKLLGMKTFLESDKHLVIEDPSSGATPARVVNKIWKLAEETETIIHSLVPARNSLEEIFISVVAEANHANS